MATVALVWDLIAKDSASGPLNHVATAADRAAAATGRAAGAQERLNKVGKSMTTHATVPILAAAAASIKLASDFQQSTNVLVTAAGESTKRIDLIRQGILNISKTTGTSWKQVTDGIYLLEKAGYRGAAALGVEKAAAQGAKEEGANLATVTQALTSIMASYHLRASKAVMVTNEMKTAAGESKTTMEEFAGSLSTVLPLASANKISFADVAGSLASLTQHGTSAKEGTQELANTIRQLSAPNMVAVKEMAQLGISSVDVASKLGDGPGGRGLAGTLKYLGDAFKQHMGKNGLLTLSTLNASKLAAKDAATEYNSLGASAQKLAKGFIDGTITSKDWTSSVKLLSPEQANLARQFAVTENVARGFQQNLRNGVNPTQTYSDAIKKMAGGANGLNTALQLTGHSMDGTNERIARIAAAATGAGRNVQGWAITQQNAATQAGIFRSSLDALGISVGTGLLPMFTGLVKTLTGVVTWFQNLNGSQREVLGWSLGIVAAIGPVLKITGKLMGVGRGISTFASGVGSRMASLAGATEAGATRVGLAMGRVGTALGGAAIGYAVGSLTAHASTATKAIGVLGSAAAGAALGAAGGPVGIAIGGIAGGLSALATQFFTAGDAGKTAGQKAAAAAQAAQQRIQDQARAVDGLTQSIMADSDAIGKNTRAQVANDLYKSGALGLAQKAGLSPGLVTSAALSGAGSPANRKLQAQITAQFQKSIRAGGLVGTTGTAASDLTKLLPLLRQEGVYLGQAGQSADLNTLATGKLNLARRRAAVEVRFYGNTLDQATVAGRMNAEFIKDHVVALGKQYSAGKLTVAQWREQISTLQDQLGQYKFNGAAVAAYIARFAKIPKSVATKLLADPKIANSSIGVVLRTLLRMPASKTTDLLAKDKTLPVMTNLSTMLGRYTAPQTVTINANVDPALAGLAAFQRAEGLLQDKTVRVNVIGGAGSNVVKGAAAAGAIIRGPGTGTSDTAGVWALSNGEAVIPEKAVSRHRGVVDWLIRKGRGLAGGGVVKPDQAALSSTAATAIGSIGSQPGAKFSVATVGIATILGQIKHAWAVLQQESAKGLSAAAHTAFANQLNQYTKMAERQLVALKNKVAGADLGAVRHAGLFGTAADTQTAVQALLADAKNAGLSAAAMSRIVKAEGGIVRDQQQRDRIVARLGSAPTAATAYDRLASEQQAYSSTRTSVAGAVGAFDITGVTAPAATYSDQKPAGLSASTILASLKAAGAKAARFGRILRKLAREGLAKDLLSQLAAAGPQAMDTATALAAATPKQIADITGDYRKLWASGQDAGKFMADKLNGAGVASAQGLVNGLLSKESDINKAIKKIADGMKSTLKHELGIHSPSTVMRWHGQMTGEGFRLGMLDKAASIADASDGYANAATPSSQQASWQRGGDTHNWHIYEASDGEQVAHAVIRRMSFQRH